MQKLHFGKLNTATIKNTLTVFSVGVLISFSSCVENKKVDEENTKEVPKEEVKSNNLFEMEGKVFSVPSPLQTALLLKKSGSTYDASLLNPTASVSNYTTTSHKALNLGIYGADLGYATIYDQSQDALNYIVTTRTLANELGVANVFEESLIKRFESNLNNKDSLLTLFTTAFRKSDQYLKESKQNQLAALILTGGWIETLHFATKIASASKKDEVVQRIGEQKITLENLIKLLMSFKDDENSTQLLSDLNELKDIYSNVTYTYEFKEPSTDAANKVTTINSTSKTEVSDEVLKNLTAKVDAIRNNIIK